MSDESTKKWLYTHMPDYNHNHFLKSKNDYERLMETFEDKMTRVDLDFQYQWDVWRQTFAKNYPKTGFVKMMDG